MMGRRLGPLAVLLLTGFVLTLSISCDGARLEDAFEELKPPPHIHGKFAYVTWTKEKGYDIKIFGDGVADVAGLEDGIDWVAKGRYQNMINKTGWGFVEVESRESWPDEMQTYAAGMAEGYLTHELIYYFWRNMIEHYCDEKPTLCKFIQKFIGQNQDWVTSSIKLLQDDSSYWHQVNLVYQQMEGIKFGYRKAAEPARNISDLDFLLMNIQGDLMDLESALNPNPSRSKYGGTPKDGHCSVLIKLIENRDIYASHVAWWRYETMLRLIKKYNFPVKTTAGNIGVPVPGVSISMSSYPGMISSMDDFYTVSSGLFITETSLENFNQDLWSKVSPQNSLYTGIRAMVANRLAEDGRQWTKLFTPFNSGTYNNQWMVLNYGLYEPGKPLNDGLLWILEQLPGLIVSKDVTSVLSQNGYWASYNVPYFLDIFEISGNERMQAKFGDYYSHDNSPRAKIFARDQTKVNSTESMMHLMRYNDYQHDPFSKCNCTPPYSAVMAISARAELNPADGKYPFPALGHRQMGATDMKLTTLDLFTLQKFIAIGGPTYESVPPFQWSTSSLNKLPHYGMPDKFQFEPITHNWHWL